MLAPILLALAAACGEPTASDTGTTPAGSYTLHTVAGRPLPFVQSANEYGDSVRV